MKAAAMPTHNSTAKNVIKNIFCFLEVSIVAAKHAQSLAPIESVLKLSQITMQVFYRNFVEAAYKYHA